MPIDDKHTILHPPLAFGYIASQLKANGHSVICLDLPLEKNRWEKIDDALSTLDKAIIGITCVTQTYAIALKIARYIKRKFYQFHIVLGGPHVTFTARETLERFSYIDFVCLYEGEYTFTQLATALEENIDTFKFKTIPGFAYRNGSSVVLNSEPEPIMELDMIGVPDRSIFDMKSYLLKDYETVIMTSRGCPNGCSFCSASRIGRKYRKHSIDYVANQIEQLLDMGFKSFFFGDDTFPGDKERTVNFCRTILERRLNFDWTCNMRVLDVEVSLMTLMREAGMYRTFIGFETFDNSSLTQMRKGSNFNMEINAAAILKSLDVELHTSMIVGCANDTRDTILNNVDFLKNIISPTIATFNTIELRPGTDMYMYPQKYGYAMSDPQWYEDIDCVNRIHVRTQYLSEEEIRSVCGQCYERFYSS